jgi:hypothetical protein
MSNEGFKNVPGVPEGWEFLAIRRGRYGEWHINADGKPELVRDDTANLLCIIRKIEVTKKYRPFANAEEFKPHRDRWAMHPSEPSKRFRTGDYNDDGLWGNDRRFYFYGDLLESGSLFDDGTPFGVEVTE